MKKTVVTVLKVLAVLAIFAAVAAFVSYDTPAFDKVIESNIARQLETTYGTSFKIFSLSERNPIVPDFTEELTFEAYTEDKIYMSGTCDWKGKIISENYIYYYYAPVMVSEVEEIIDGSFDEFFVVQDFARDRDFVASNPMLFNSVKDADDYMIRVYKGGTYFRVYVKEGVTDAELWDALYKLQGSGYGGHVFLIAVNEKWYNALQSWEYPFYPMQSEAYRVIAMKNGLLDADVDDFIRDPSPNIRGDYNPVNGFIQVVGGAKYPKV